MIRQQLGFRHLAPKNGGFRVVLFSLAVRSSSSLFFDRAFGLRPVRALKEPLPRFIIAGQKDEDVTFIFTDQDARSVLLGVPNRGVIDRPSLGGASVVGTPLELLVLLIFLSFLRTALTNPESCRGT